VCDSRTHRQASKIWSRVRYLKITYVDENKLLYVNKKKKQAIYILSHGQNDVYPCGVARVSRIDEFIGLFCRISSLL